MTKKRLLGLLVVAIGTLIALPGAALAAPNVISSEPARGAELHEAPAEVTITFDMVLDSAESTLVVVDECGRRVDDGAVEITGNQVSVGIARTPSGRYEMQYRAVPPANLTGAATGSIPFTVHSGSSCGPKADSHGGHGEQDHDAGHEGHGGSDQHEGHEGQATHEEHEGPATHEQHGARVAHASHVAHAAQQGTRGSHERHRSTQRPPRRSSGSDLASTGVATDVLGLELDRAPTNLAAVSLLLCALIGAAGAALARLLLPRR